MWSRAFALKALSYMLVLVLGILVYFLDLGQAVLNHWDESRRAVNAYEMLHNGRLFVTHFQGEPDMWGTKPPLLIWLQVLSFKVFGINEFALRFPSASAALGLALSLFYFCSRHLRSTAVAFAAVAMMYTSTAFVSVHGARTGDYEMLLVLFSTQAALALYLAGREHAPARKGRRILLFFFFMSLAVLTKGIAALMLLPGMLVFLVLDRQAMEWLRSGYYWGGLVGFLLLFGGYYLIREGQNPGYVRAVIENELTGRYMETLEDSSGPFMYYLKGLYQWRFRNWFFLLPLGAILALFTGNKKLRDFVLFVLWVTGIYLLVISVGQTKHEWYDLPVLPLFILLASMFFHIVFRALQAEDSPLSASWAKRLIPGIVLLCFFFYPYYQILHMNRDAAAFRQDDRYVLSHYLRDLHQGLPEQDGPADLYLLHEGNTQYFLFYTYLLREKGVEVHVVEPDQMLPGRTYLLHQQALIKKLQAKDRLQLDEMESGMYSLRQASPNP